MAIPSVSPARTKNTSRMQRFLDYSGKDGKTALIIASINGYEDIVRKLLEYGANANIIDLQGKTALDYAVLHRHQSIVQLLQDA